MKNLTYAQLREEYETQLWESRFRWEHGDFRRSIDAAKKANIAHDKMMTFPAENLFIIQPETKFQLSY